MRKPLLPSIKDTSFFVVALIVIVLDQVIKAVIVTLPSDFSKSLLGSFLTLTSVKNFGASFGILHGRMFFLILFSVAVILMILLS